MSVRSRPTVAADAAPFIPAAKTDTFDPLLALLQRYEMELAAFNQDIGTKVVSDQEWDRIANTWTRARNEILERQLSATTVDGAISALDHVMRDENLFGERDEFADQQLLWLLVKAARDFIANESAKHTQPS
jgi:hypothetical protein